MRHPTQSYAENSTELDELLVKGTYCCALAQLYPGLHKSLRAIKERYRAIVLGAAPDEADRLLYDNYYMLEREGKLLLKSDRKLMESCLEESRLPFLGELALSVLPEGGKIDNDTLLAAIEKAQGKRYITGMQLDNIIWAVRFSVIQHIAALLHKKEDSAGQVKKLIALLASSDTIDMERITERLNPLELIYAEDPAGLYAKMSEETRWIYRYKTSVLANRLGVEEPELARRFISAAQQAKTQRERHVGHGIYREFAKENPPVSPFWYVMLLWLLPAVISAGIGLAVWSWWVPLAVYLPLWAAIKPFADCCCMRKATHERLPRLALGGQIPDHAKTLVVLSVMLMRTGDITALRDRLTRLYYANPTENLRFCVLADLREAQVPVMPEDRTLIHSAKKLLKRLNVQFGDRFLLLVRNRAFQPTSGSYVGYERKRGAIEQLIALIHGEDIPMAAAMGDMDFLRQAKYICTLDSDTKAPMDSVAELVAIALHPHNAPVMDGGIVREGYGIIAPRMVTELGSSLKTPFSKIVGGMGGSSAYDSFCADIYQDCFGEGIFAGKGLIDADCYHTLLHQKFPEERVLSHDILEGGFLRCAFAGDVEFYDSFPANSMAYFKRLHRWLRGDVQNLPYLRKTIETPAGEIPNPLTALSTFKLLDNVRRCVTPVVLMLCLLGGAFLQRPVSITLTVCALAGVLMPYLFGFIPALISGGLFTLSQRYYSGVVPQTVQLLYQGFYGLILLPQQAVIALDALVRALYRRYISHRNLLQWTPAAQTERGASDLPVKVKFFAAAEVLGIALLFSTHASSRLTGIFLVLMLPILLYADRPYKSYKQRVDVSQRQEILSQVAAMWQFYEDFAGATDHYLPPDNVQKAPVFAVAHRTSPTNIGLLMLSMLAARDFELIDSDGLCRRLARTLSTVEALPKWHGNLSNWYDTQTLELLEPAYVSSVDSGNFACAMVALKEGLREYAVENESIHELIARIEALLEQTDLSVFYDRKKRLFSIGFDTVAGKLSPNHYDLLMSEARMTSFFAIARRQVPKRHWRALGRTMARLGAYAGPISWTGTMFEYFMPELLLHCEEGTMGYEGLRFCLHCQKKRAKDTHVPFGMSESAYYAFDSQLSYQYKAHGVQKIGLKRGLDEELVVSPYASYLTLSHDFHSSYHNLERLRRMGMMGSYGLYEAVDFTPSRVGPSANAYAIVRSYMAHHVGMSILASANALLDNRMQRRFLRDRHMESAAELLDERVAEGSVLFEDVQKKETPRRNLREAPNMEVYGEFMPQQPHVHVLSNGEYTAVLTDLGACHGIYQGKDTVLRTTDLLRRPQGAYFAVCEGEEATAFTFLPAYDSEHERSAEFTEHSADYFCNTDTLQMGMKVTLHPGLPCELRKFAVKNLQSKRRKLTLAAYMEPTLASHGDFMAHPAFMRLFLKQEYDPKNRVFILSRKERHSDERVYMAVGFVGSEDFSYSMRREDILRRPFGVSACFERAGDSGVYGEQVPDPALLIKLPLTLEAHHQSEHTLFICTSNDLEELYLNVARIRGGVSKQNAPMSPMVHDTLEGRIASAILPQIVYKRRDCMQILRAVEQNTLSPRSLWGLGISGDLPIALVEVAAAVEEERVTGYIKCHRSLRLCGIPFDLVFAFRDAGEYGRPLYSFVHRHLKRLGGEGLLGGRGGVHLVDLTSHEEEIYTLLQAAAVHIAPKSMMRIGMPAMQYSPVAIRPVARPDTPVNGTKVAFGAFTEDGFAVTGRPPVPWCTVLANPEFGTLVSESALGFTWAINSRENKLTPWFNDLMTDNRGERLIARHSGEYFDLVDGATARFTPAMAAYEGVAGALFSRVTVSVSDKGCAKHIEAELENRSDQPLEIELAYYTEPCLSDSREHARQISGVVSEDTLLLRNPFNASVKGCMALAADRPLAGYTMDRAAFLSGRWEERILDPSNECCAAVIVRIELPPKHREKIRFILSFGSTGRAAAEMARLAPIPKHEYMNSIRVTTPDALLNHLMNTWLPWQTIGARMHARTGFYQNGGAYGFRDQLQDAITAALFEPDLTKRQILRSCAAQFAEGDVLHWWHNLPDGVKKGVRTRCSDDLVWLPYTVCEYIDKTGDDMILDIPVCYCFAPLLEDSEHEKYFEVTKSELCEDVYTHCKRALAHAYRLGEHGLPLMGSGDWNDGYNGVGIEGKGESVWLALFLAITLEKFSALAHVKGDIELVQECLRRAEGLKKSVEAHCWDGQWYIRAFYDNGAKMGAQEQRECKIDSLSQSFAALAKLPNTQRTAIALSSAVEQLVDTKAGIIRLFTPALTGRDQPAGYVTAYPAGIRENGGQYTHGAVWLTMALYEAGMGEQAFSLLRMLSPAHRHLSEADALRYRNEPYYMSADVYTNYDCYGRGGWSIYTGAAGWYYRLVLEYLLGIRIKGHVLEIKPDIPRQWNEFSVCMRIGRADIRIQVARGEQKGILVDGHPVHAVRLDGTSHEVTVTI